MSTDLPAPDVIDLLVTQHARIEELFKQVLTTQGQERRDTWFELVRLLSVHETAEEELVHPLARGSIDSDDAVVNARLAEEQDAKQMLSALYDCGPDHPEFEPRLRALREAVLAHATHEERYEFPRLRQASPALALQALAPAVRAAEATAPTRPHPGVESATANLLLGPLVAFMDRTRDAIRDVTQRRNHDKAEQQT